MALERSLVCLDCRARVDASEPCDCKNMRLDRRVDLRRPEGRKALVDEVWGSASAKRLARDAARAGATGASVGGASNVLDCTSCGSGTTIGDGASGAGDALSSDIATFFVVIAVAAIVFVILYFLIRWIVRSINEYRNRPRPHGALVRPLPFLGSGVHGRVARASDAAGGEVSPSGVKCLAWTSELQHRRVLGEGAMLRDASTRGFEITLDDNRKVRIPPGRVRIEEPPVRIDDDVLRESGYLHRVDPLGFDGQLADDDPFPFDHADERRIVVGDHVELMNPLTLQVDPTLDAGYREAGGALVPEGVPRLRVRSGRDSRDSG